MGLPSFLTASYEQCLLVTLVCTVWSVLLAFIHVVCFCCGRASFGVKIHVVEIVLIVPIYAINAHSCFKHVQSPLMLPEAFELLRELYEAVVILAFIQLVLEVLGGPQRVARAFRAELQRPQHVWVTCFPTLSNACGGCLRRIPMPFYPGENLLAGLLVGILQFAKWSLAFFIVCCGIWIYCLMVPHSDPDFFNKLETVPLLIKSASMGIAMYCVILLLVELERSAELIHQLEKFRPHLKFWSIKLFVFLPIIQKVVVEKLLPFFGVLDQYANDEWTTMELGVALQNFLISIETALFSVFIFCAFQRRDFETEEGEPSGDFENEEGLSVVKFLRQINKLVTHANKLRRMYKSLVAVGIPPERAGEIFDQIDADGGGTISDAEFRFVLELTGLPTARIDEIITQADENPDGIITREEFTQWAEDLYRQRGESGAMTAPLARTMHGS